MTTTWQDILELLNMTKATFKTAKEEDRAYAFMADKILLHGKEYVRENAIPLMNEWEEEREHETRLLPLPLTRRRGLVLRLHRHLHARRHDFLRCRLRRHILCRGVRGVMRHNVGLCWRSARAHDTSAC